MKPLYPDANWQDRLHYERLTRLESLMGDYQRRLRDNPTLAGLWSHWTAGRFTFEEMLLTAVLCLDDHNAALRKMALGQIELPRFAEAPMAVHMANDGAAE